MESELKSVFKKNVGVVGCFKGVSNDDFSMITGCDAKFYQKQFDVASLLISLKSDFYLYLPSLIYGEKFESNAEIFMKRLVEINDSLPLRLQMFEVENYPGASINIVQKAKEGRPMPTTDQKSVFAVWHELLKKYFSKERLAKFSCEVPL